MGCPLELILHRWMMAAPRVGRSCANIHRIAAHRAVQVVAAANPLERRRRLLGAQSATRQPFHAYRMCPEVDRRIEGITAGFTLRANGRVAQPSRERTAIARVTGAAFIRTRLLSLTCSPPIPR
jgi:hypothetical protein